MTHSDGCCEASHAETRLSTPVFSYFSIALSISSPVLNGEVGCNKTTFFG